MLDGHSLASRLAAFLWLSIPDATLRELAESDELTNPKGLEKALQHLIADDRFDSFCATFMEQWLDLDRLKGLNPTLEAAMRAEPSLLFRETVREDRSILDLLDARHTWLNESLAEHYGIAGVSGHDMRSVLLDSDRRGGLLAMGGVLDRYVNPAVNQPSRPWSMDCRNTAWRRTSATASFCAGTETSGEGSHGARRA